MTDLRPVVYVVAAVLLVPASVYLIRHPRREGDAVGTPRAIAFGILAAAVVMGMVATAFL